MYFHVIVRAVLHHLMTGSSVVLWILTHRKQLCVEPRRSSEQRIAAFCGIPAVLFQLFDNRKLSSFMCLDQGRAAKKKITQPVNFFLIHVCEQTTPLRCRPITHPLHGTPKCSVGRHCFCLPPDTNIEPCGSECGEL